MRLNISKSINGAHGDFCTSVAWFGSDAISAGDDGKITSWNSHGEKLNEILKNPLPTQITAIQVYIARGRQVSPTDMFAIACTDGTFKLISFGGKIEKSVEAHSGATLCLKWSLDGQAILSGGEDGLIKVWSRSGMLRSTLVQSPNCVYSLAWSPQNDYVAYVNGKDIFVKPLQPGSKTTTWKAHDGVVLLIDWNPINKMIVSAGEDRKYKIWDQFGRCMYSSAPMDHVVTSLNWSPDGELIAIGSFNLIRLCNRAGWSYSRTTLPESGSIYGISWTSDSTQLIASSARGNLYFANVVDMQLQSESLDIILDENNRLIVNDVSVEASEELEFHDRVIKMSIGWNRLVVATLSQISIFSTTNWSASPVIFDVKDNVSLIKQSDRFFLTVDTVNGVQIFSYDGRLTCTPKHPGLKTDFLNSSSIDLSIDTLAVIDQSDPRQILLFEAASGRLLSSMIKHEIEIVEIYISNYGPIAERKLVFIDSNRDMFITSVIKPTNLHKLGTMVSSAKWHSSTDMLLALMDEKLVLFCIPSVIFVDRDLLAATKYIRDGSEFGKSPLIVSFSGVIATIQKDGAIITAQFSPYPLMLYEQHERKEWERAVALCRFVKDTILWASLASMSLISKNLDTAEVALAAIDSVDKLRFINFLKDIPKEEIRNAKLALYRRQPQEAETIYLQANLPFRAIEMHVELFNWDKALELAIKFQIHIDTVLYERKKYLNALGTKESKPQFIQYNQQVKIDEDVIKLKLVEEKAKLFPQE